LSIFFLYVIVEYLDDLDAAAQLYRRRQHCEEFKSDHSLAGHARFDDCCAATKKLFCFEGLRPQELAEGMGPTITAIARGTGMAHFEKQARDAVACVTLDIAQIALTACSHADCPLCRFGLAQGPIEADAFNANADPALGQDRGAADGVIGEELP